MTQFSIMKFIIICLVSICSFFTAHAQNVESCFEEGEFLEFKVKYLSFNTSTATLKIKKEVLNNKSI